MNQPVVCIESAKIALESTKEVQVFDEKSREIKTQTVVDIEAVKKSVKFLAGYAFKVTNQG